MVRVVICLVREVSLKIVLGVIGILCFKLVKLYEVVYIVLLFWVIVSVILGKWVILIIWVICLFKVDFVEGLINLLDDIDKDKFKNIRFIILVYDNFMCFLFINDFLEFSMWFFEV